MKRALIVALVLLGACAAPAQAYVRLAADSTRQRGYITLFVQASANFKTGYLAERAGDGYEPIGAFEFTYRGVDPVIGPVSEYVLAQTIRWRCDRLERDFGVAAYADDGTVEITHFTVRTPSCRKRLELDAPAHVRAGDDVAVTVRDTWGYGATQATLCFADRPCRTIAFADGQAEASTVFHTRDRGLRTLSLRAPAQRVTVPVGVGVRPPAAGGPPPTIVTTGDSMMQSIDSILGDRLDSEARVVSDVHAGTGLVSKADDWVGWARERVAADHPDATLMFLGANDVYAMTTPAGSEVACCGSAWRTEYARRAGRLMRVYAQGGRGTVLWLLLPIMQDARRQPAMNAVNAALRTAAAKFPTVELVDLGDVLTPGGRFRKTLRVGGQRVRVREDDGIHLTVAGARLAVIALRDLLTDVGLLTPAR